MVHGSFCDILRSILRSSKVWGLFLTFYLCLRAAPLHVEKEESDQREKGCFEGVSTTRIRVEEVCITLPLILVAIIGRWKLIFVMLLVDLKQVIKGWLKEVIRI